MMKLIGGLAVFWVPMAVNAGVIGTVTVSWSQVGSTPVPTLGTYAIVALAILISVLVARMLKNQQRNIALGVIGAFTASALFYYPDSDAQGDPPPLLQTGCQGQITRAADYPFHRPLQNTCGLPIRVRYDWSGCPVEGIRCLHLHPAYNGGPCIEDGEQIQPGQVYNQLICGPTS